MVEINGLRQFKYILTQSIAVIISYLYDVI